jgi:hypothetical protein
MLATAEQKTRKAFSSILIKDMKAKYEKQSTAGSDQLKALDKCFQYKRPQSNDFLRIANDIFGIKNKKAD